MLACHQGKGTHVRQASWFFHEVCFWSARSSGGCSRYPEFKRISGSEKRLVWPNFSWGVGDARVLCGLCIILMEYRWGPGKDCHKHPSASRKFKTPLLGFWLSHILYSQYVSFVLLKQFSVSFQILSSLVSNVKRVRDDPVPYFHSTHEFGINVPLSHWDQQIMAFIICAVFTPGSSLFPFMREQNQQESSQSFHFLYLAINERNAAVSWLLWQASKAQYKTTSKKLAHDTNYMLPLYYTPSSFVWFG